MSDPKYAWQLHDLPLLDWPSSVLAQRNNPAEHAAANDSYIVANSPTGEWIDRVNQIATWTSDSTWVFQVPARGRRVFVHSIREHRQFDGRAWVPDEPATSLPPGGLMGYVLTKITDADGDADWQVPMVGGGGGGSTNVILRDRFETIEGGLPEGSLIITLGHGFNAYGERGGVYERIGTYGLTYRGSISQAGIPEGGTTGQVLAKTSNSDFVAAWVDPEDGAGGDITSVTAGNGLSGGGTGGDVTLTVSWGTTSTTSCVGNDSRLSNDRTASGLRTASGIVAVSSATAPTTGQVLRATSGTTATWQDIEDAIGDGDITAVIAGTGLTGGATSGPATLTVSFGNGSGQACEGNDSRLSNDRVANAIRTASGTVTVSSATAPTSGQALVATGPTPASWQDISDGGGGGDITAVVAGSGLTGGATTGSATLAVDFGTGSTQVRPGNDAAYTNARTTTGSAGGDLSGAYPSPTVVALHSSATQLTIGAIDDGEFLQRSGAAIVGVAGASAPQPTQVNGSLIGTRDAIDIVAGTGISVSGTDDFSNGRVRVTIAATTTGDITEVAAGTGLTGGASSGVATLAVNFGTSSTQVRPGNDAAFTDARTPTGTAGGDLGGTYPNPTVTALHSSATQLTVGTIVDGEFLVRSGATIASSAGTSAPQPVQVDGVLVGTRDAIDLVAGTNVTLNGVDDSANNRVRVTINSTGGGGGGGGTFDPDDLDPYIRYTASAASSSGGFVDTMTDLGSAGKNMTASSTNRCAIGTDSNGQLYYDFTGNRIYTAGTTTDWTWMHDNTKQYTVIVVMSKASPTAVASEGILATMNWSSNSRGMVLGHGNNAGTGFDFGINNGSAWSAYAVVNRAAAPYNTGIEVISFVSNRDVRPGSTNNMQFSSNSITAQRAAVNAYIGKTLVAQSYSPNATWSTSNAAGALTLGGMVDGNVKLTARIYEIFITRQSLSCYDIHNYATWAADHYEFSLADW